jgi:peptidoglycan hydrolase-like protein with peptidoglycan-binding domain
MKTPVAALIILLGCAGAIYADEVTAEVQQALKDQGFYYGEIDGEKNADTVAAIRRYQIRNGLKITGELDNATLRALRSVPSTSSPPPVAKAPASPVAPSPPAQAERENPATTPAPEEEQEGPQPPQFGPVNPPPYPGGQDRQLYPPNVPNAPNAPAQQGGLFADTPYATAPPAVQRNVVISAQSALSRRGYYHGSVDGVYASALEFSLRAYQSKVGLPVTGRLDLETLAALELLPGAKAPVYRPRRRVPPPVRGEWVRP